MFLGKSHIHKAFSASLLGVLLFIHSIKLLHTHSLAQLDAKVICKRDASEKDSHANKNANKADCSICIYQIGKDADDYFIPANQIFIPAPDDLNVLLLSDNLLSSSSAFEGRGPPCLG